MQWTYKGEPIDELPSGFVGFLYLITNTTNGKMYVGKKLAVKKVVRKPLKGKTNKRRSTVDSDWKTYYGSSDNVKADVEVLGEDKFSREILEFFTTRGMLSYAEMKYQVVNDVLFRDDYYNSIIQARIHRRHVFAK